MDVKKLQAVLEAALAVEDGLVEIYEAQGKTILAREHFYWAGGIMYAIQLMVDPTYLRKQAEILDAEPAPKDIDAETAQILEIERELRKPRVYHPQIEAMRQKGIG